MLWESQRREGEKVEEMLEELVAKLSKFDERHVYKQPRS